MQKLLNGVVQLVVIAIFIVVVSFVPLVVMDIADMNPNSHGAIYGGIALVVAFVLMPVIFAFDKDGDTRPTMEKLKELPRMYWGTVQMTVLGAISSVWLIFMLIIAGFIVLGLAGLLLFGVRQLF